MQKILLDATRLYTRKRASTPSGIDRVDIRYLEHFRSGEVEYVISWLGCLFLADQNTVSHLSNQLKDKWENGNKTNKLPSLLKLTQANPLELIWVTLRNLLPESWGTRQKYSSTLVEYLNSSPDSWLYINTSHVQLRSIPAIRDLSTLVSIQHLFFIHDLIPITHHEYVRPGGSEQHEKRLQLLLDTQANVVANSNYTKTQLLLWSNKQKGGMEDKDVKVISIGVEPNFNTEKTTSPPAERPYFLMLGTIEPRKNHLLVLNVWRRLIEEGIKDIPKLVIIGKRGWENENIIDMLERCSSIEPYIIEHQHVSDDELKTYLEHCKALIYPSFVEGWGMPVAEALAMGVPVICSNIDVFQEVGQGCPTYIDPLNGIALAETIKHFSPQPYEYATPTWGAHFKKLDTFIKANRPTSLHSE